MRITVVLLNKGQQWLEVSMSGLAFLVAESACEEAGLVALVLVATCGADPLWLRWFLWAEPGYERMHM